ncbi:hypothetical protein GGH16_003218, partial [Coemansia sp. RSA 560]
LTEWFILREIHDITFFPRQVTQFTVLGKYYYQFLGQCEVMIVDLQISDLQI